MRRIILIILAISSISLFTPLSAQDDDFIGCATITLEELQTMVTEDLAAMEKAVATSDVERWVEVARGLRNTLAIVDGFCRGFSWDSETEGQLPVIGPVLFPDGLYRATVTTNDYLTLRIETLSGDCDPGGGRALFILSADDASDGAQAVFRSDSCAALIEISRVDEDWELSFELISEG